MYRIHEKVRSSSAIIKSFAYLPIENCINDLLNTIYKLRITAMHRIYEKARSSIYLIAIIKSFAYLPIENFTNDLLSDNYRLRITATHRIHEKATFASSSTIIKSYLSIENYSNDFLSDDSQVENHCYAQNTRKSKIFERNY